MRFINLDELLKFPIRKNNYDKEHGNENFIYGVECVLDYAEELPVLEMKYGVWRPMFIEKVDGTHLWCFQCSVCGLKKPETFLSIRNEFYCSNCGSSMTVEGEG